MRVDPGPCITGKCFVVFDEFTSVVDRKVAQTASLAVSKAVRRAEKQFIAVSCHYDILDWLEPDWVFDTNTMTDFFGKAHALKSDLQSGDADTGSGQSLGVIII